MKNPIKLVLNGILKIVLLIFTVMLSLFTTLFGVYALTNFYSDLDETEAMQINTQESSPDPDINLTSEDETDTNTLIVLGDVFGIKIYTDGLIVSSLQSFNSNGENICPASDAGIEVGDYILSVEGVAVINNTHFSDLLSQYLSDSISLEVQRGDEVFTVEINPVLYEGYYRLGMWIRDSAAGIGTLTFYDPNTGIFAGLGHGICDVDTGELMCIKDGEPAEVIISSIQKSTEGEPGKINGYFSNDENLGILIENTETGIYGKLDEVPEGEEFEIASDDEISTGFAEIICTVENGETKKYEINIEKVYDNDDNTKNMIIKITDEELLEITGGIVQGMSGSPIIQNGKIIGALTHVFVNDTTSGYGIFISNMLETVNSLDE